VKQRSAATLLTIMAVGVGLALTQITACGCPNYHYAPTSGAQRVGVPVLLSCTPQQTQYVDGDGAFWSATPDRSMPFVDSPNCSDSGSLLAGVQSEGTPILVYTVSFTQLINLVRTVPPQGEVAQSSPAAIGTSAVPLCPNPVHLLGNTEIDFDHALWVGADGVPADCTTGTVRLIDTAHAVASKLETAESILQRVNGAGVPLGPPPSLPSIAMQRVNVPCAVSGHVPYGGYQWSPAPGQVYPAGHEPDCRRDPTATLLSNGRLHVTWAGRTEDLVRYRGAPPPTTCA
jgi:hypothetical protein